MSSSSGKKRTQKKSPSGIPDLEDDSTSASVSDEEISSEQKPRLESTRKKEKFMWREEANNKRFENNLEKFFNNPTNLKHSRKTQKQRPASHDGIMHHPFGSPITKV